jgi:hypothetical protein
LKVSVKKRQRGGKQFVSDYDCRTYQRDLHCSFLIAIGG